MCVCVCVCVHVCMCLCVYVCVCACVYVYAWYIVHQRNELEYLVQDQEFGGPVGSTIYYQQAVGSEVMDAC